MWTCPITSMGAPGTGKLVGDVQIHLQVLFCDGRLWGQSPLSCPAWYLFSCLTLLISSWLNSYASSHLFAVGHLPMSDLFGKRATLGLTASLEAYMPSCFLCVSSLLAVFSASSLSGIFHFNSYASNFPSLSHLSEHRVVCWMQQLLSGVAFCL